MIIAFYVGFSKGEGVGVEKTINTFVRLNMVEEIDEEEFFDDEVWLWVEYVEKLRRVFSAPISFCDMVYG